MTVVATVPSPIIAPPIALLESGQLFLDVDTRALDRVEGWLPRIPRHGANPTADAARIRVSVNPVPPLAPTERPLFTMAGVEGHREADSGRVHLYHKRGSGWGMVDLAARRADLSVAGGALAPGERDMAAFTLLTLASALLLNRMGGALVHAAAVAPEGKGAWLLAGDSFSGKTTTSVNLIRGGWSYLSDDHVVLSAHPDGGGVGVEGWPRAFHLDEGFDRGVSTGSRGTVDPGALAPGRWRRSAPVAGLLFPRVEADRPTALERIDAGDALARLIRQSPWLLSDPPAAPAVLRLMQCAANLPAYALRLGTDTFRHPARLLEVLAPATEVGGG